MTVTEILHQVWERSEGDLVFLPYKDTEADQWQEGVSWMPDDEQLPIDLQPRGCDVFFTPVRYVDAPRTADNQGRVGVLYADLDNDYDPEMLDAMPPTLLWETSPGNLQAIWFLDQAVSPAEAIGLNRRLSHLLHADHGSWIATKVLRIPESVNYKRGGVRGTIRHWYPEIVYPVEQLELDLPYVPMPATLATPHPPVPTPAEHRKLLEQVWSKLDHRTKELLVLDKVPDRSLHLARLAKRLRAISLTPDQIFGILSRLPSNKFWNRPEVLWKSVVLTSDI